MSITKEQKELIDRFMNAFIAIETFLREKLHEDKNTPFSQLVKNYQANYPRQAGGDLLLKVSDLRNAIVHQRGPAQEYLSIPVLSLVEHLERIHEEWTSPIRVFPKFDKKVTCFQAKDILPNVLKEISEKEFSQFPVYQEDRFLGLLTESGITRWLSHHSTKVLTLVELEDATVEKLLNQEEQRKNYHFISRVTTLLDAENLFVKNTLLEALLITEKGISSEKLLGIMTRWDVLNS